MKDYDDGSGHEQAEFVPIGGINAEKTVSTEEIEVLRAKAIEKRDLLLSSAPVINYSDTSTKVPGGNLMQKLGYATNWDTMMKGEESGSDILKVAGRTFVIYDIKVADYITRLEDHDRILIQLGLQPVLGRSRQIRGLGNLTDAGVEFTDKTPQKVLSVASVRNFIKDRLPGKKYKIVSKGGIITDQSTKEWNDTKKVVTEMVGPGLRKERFPEFMQTMDDAFERYFNEIEVGNNVDFVQNFHKLNLDVIMKQLTGLDHDELSEAFKIRGLNSEEMITKFLANFQWGALLSVVPGQVLEIERSLPGTKRIKKSMAEFGMLIKDISLSSGRDSIIKGLVEKGLNNSKIVANIEEVISAGVDTTTSALNAALAFIYSKGNEESLGKVMEEIAAVNMDDPKEFQAFVKAAYKTEMGRIFTDSLRLRPVIPYAPVDNNFPLVFPTADGRKITVKKGSNILVSLPGINRRAVGDDEPDKFKPSRYEISDNTSADDLKKMKNNIVSFWKGIRACAGQDMATYVFYRTTMKLIKKLNRYDAFPTMGKPDISKGTTQVPVSWSIQAKQEA